MEYIFYFSRKQITLNLAIASPSFLYSDMKLYVTETFNNFMILSYLLNATLRSNLSYYYR